MAGRGVHFAISEEEWRALTGLSSDEAKVEYVSEVIEERYFDSDRLSSFMVETDKAWYALHCLLAERTTAQVDANLADGVQPLVNAILGGERVLEDEEAAGYWIVARRGEVIDAIAAALQAIDYAEFDRRYALYAKEIGERLEDDEFDDYCWHWFQELRDFYVRSAGAGRVVIFTVDV